jgi:tryptophan synthase beta subunit
VFGEHLSCARSTFDKFQIIAHASGAVDKTRRIEQKTDLEVKGPRWALLKDYGRLSASQQGDREALLAQLIRAPHAAPVVHQCHALEGRAREGRLPR